MMMLMITNDDDDDHADDDDDNDDDDDDDDDNDENDDDACHQAFRKWPEVIQAKSAFSSDILPSLQGYIDRHQSAQGDVSSDRTFVEGSLSLTV